MGLQLRVQLAFSLIQFFCGLTGRTWDDLSHVEQMEVHAFLASL